MDDGYSTIPSIFAMLWGFGFDDPFPWESAVELLWKVTNSYLSRIFGQNLGSALVQ